MPTFTVTVEFSGTKTYEINANNAESVHALFGFLSTFDTYDNPIDDCVTETIIKLEPKPNPEPNLNLTETE